MITKSGLGHEVHDLSIKDSSGKLLTHESDVRDKCKQYFNELYNFELNVDNATLYQL